MIVRAIGLASFGAILFAAHLSVGCRPPNRDEEAFEGEAEGEGEGEPELSGIGDTCAADPDCVQDAVCAASWELGGNACITPGINGSFLLVERYTSGPSCSNQPDGHCTEQWNEGPIVATIDGELAGSIYARTHDQPGPWPCSNQTGNFGDTFTLTGSVGGGAVTIDLTPTNSDGQGEIEAFSLDGTFEGERSDGEFSWSGSIFGDGCGDPDFSIDESGEWFLLRCHCDGGGECTLNDYDSETDSFSTGCF